jgi:hypothetical protein
MSETAGVVLRSADGIVGVLTAATSMAQLQIGKPTMLGAVG